MDARSVASLCCDPDLTRELKRLSRSHETTLFATLLAAWAVVLAKLSGEHDLVVGMPTTDHVFNARYSEADLFVGTRVLRVDVSDEPSVAQLLARARQTFDIFQDYLDLPSEGLIQATAQPQQANQTPLRHAIFTWSAAQAETITIPELLFEPVGLQLDLREEDDGNIVGGISYATALFDASTIERHRHYLIALLRAFVADAEQPVARIDLLSADERTLLLDTWNQTEAPYPSHLCIHQLFEQQVQRDPDAIALVYEEQSLSYVQLNEQANRLAHHLIGLGVKPGDFVATILERSSALVIAQLAILKVGAAYVPIDPQAPGTRQSWMIYDCAARLVITDAACAVPEDIHVPVVLVPLISNDVVPAQNLDLLLPSEEPAYVMYTSGSTGNPKGVIVPHQAVIRLLVNNGYATFEPADRIAWLGNLAFDISTLEVWAPLLHGACLVVVAYPITLQPQLFRDFLQQHRISVLHLTAGLFRQVADFLGGALSQLRMLFVGGDTVDLSTIQRVLQKYRPQHLLHCYGPTESTTFATTYELTADDKLMHGLPIGRPIANTRIYLLDAYGQPVPLGAAGEIHIGGAGVARGYLNRPDLTAERFLHDPFSPTPGARMYRTGDLARYLPDGNIEFLGRNDHQVKIRGFRIELGEIEARLAEHPAVREAVVLAREDAPGDKRLVAYVVPQTKDPVEDAPPLAALLRTDLSAQLPEYMVPAAYVLLDAFPLTPNGKLDRKALPMPDDTALVRRDYEPPQGEIETTLAQLWMELLGLERVGRHDHFFELGGHSLIAVQLMERLRRHGLSTQIRTLFATPILSELAATLQSHHDIPIPPNVITPYSETITPDMVPLIDLTQADIDYVIANTPGGVRNIQDLYALTPLQDGILFHHLLTTEGDPYLLVSQMAFTKRELLDRYLDAVQQVAHRHDILRTAILWDRLSHPVQVVWRHAPLSVTELVLDPQDGPVCEQLSQRLNPHHYRLDLTQAPLLRFFIAQDPETDRWILQQLQHHVIGDHTTMAVLYTEVQAVLAGHSQGLAIPQPFRNLVAQTRLGADQDEHEHFFRAQLADIDAPTIPFGLMDVHHDGNRLSQARRVLPQQLNDRLRAQARSLGVSLASLCHLAWGQVIARASGRQSVVFGTVLFGRMHAGEGIDRAMGPFINTLPLRLDLNEQSVEEAVKHTHLRLAELLRHEHASLAVAQRCSGVMAPAPLFSALLNYRHNTPLASSEQNAAMEGIEWLGGEERTNYPFTLSVEDFGYALGLTAQVIQPLSPERLCGYMQQTLESLVDALETHPNIPTCQLDILSADERTLLLDTWNQTEAPYPSHLCIHQLFEQQVQRDPDAIALVYEEQSLSYVQLNEQANRLAHHLIGLGVKPDDRVAICVERSPAMVVGLLAVLKAGGAYVPLDPAYPCARLLQILDDAAPHILLGDTVGRQALGEQALDSLNVIDLQADHLAWEGGPSDNPDPTTLGLTSSHLAYIIYTSGSTGTPKGVMVEHAQTVNLLCWSNDAFINSDSIRMLFSTSINFDLSIYECFFPLASGGKVYIVNNALDLFHTEQYINILNTTPSAIKSLLGAHKLGMLTSIINLAGEPHKRDLIADIFDKTRSTKIYNLYGPSEATTYSTSRLIVQHDPFINSIGRPIANTRIYLLDAYGQPVPLGAVGEIHIGGAGVARGYLNRPDLTAERFLHDPFSPTPGARMYRTGDLARYLPDGNIEFLGRNDHQVKIRGFRIELGEIEARLAEHPAVREAVVLAREDAPGDKRLVAYVVPQTKDPVEDAPPPGRPLAYGPECTTA